MGGSGLLLRALLFLFALSKECDCQQRLEIDSPPPSRFRSNAGTSTGITISGVGGVVVVVDVMGRSLTIRPFFCAVSLTHVVSLFDCCLMISETSNDPSAIPSLFVLFNSSSLPAY